MNAIEKEKLQINLALKFANCLIDKKYDEAFSLLSKEMKEEFSAQNLEKEMLSMIEYFYTPNTIFIPQDYIDEECEVEDNYIYIPIKEDGNSEAINIEVDYEENTLVILDLEFGRP